MPINRMSLEGKYPKVSVITPAYNRASLLDETMQSVLGQDYPNLEYIVLDDGSTDGTLEVIKKYEGRIVWASHPNMGETRTVNQGFSMATGEIIGVINSDDPLRPRAISRLVEQLVTHPEVLVVYPDWDIIDEHGKFLQKVTTREYSYATMLRDWFCIPGPAAFFRSSLIKELGGRDPAFRLVGDFDFWLRAGLVGPFMRVSETLANFRHHAGSASLTGKGDAMAWEHVRLLKKIYSLPNLPAEAFKVKRETFSAAYFLAASFCPARSRLNKRFYRLAFLYSPRRFFADHPGCEPVAETATEKLALLLPDILVKGLKLIGAVLARARNSLVWRSTMLRTKIRSIIKHRSDASVSHHHE